MNICVTGCLGFIGFNIINNLLKRKNINILGIDNIDNSIYPIEEKKEKLKVLKKIKNFNFLKIDISNVNSLNSFYKKNKISYTINLAGQASVRNSLKDYNKFIKDNILGFNNIISLCNKYNSRLIYASTSSVYNSKLNKYPNSIKETNYRPQSIYGLSKYMNELTSDIYFQEYGFKSLGLRFFTVYGDYPRTDMAIFKFIDGIFKSKKIKLYNFGNYYRDFVHIDLINECIDKIIFKKMYGHRVYNLGDTNSIKLTTLIKKLEKIIGKKARISLDPPLIDEPIKTQADMIDTNTFFKGFNQKSIDEGLKQTVQWYKKNYL